MGKSGAGGVVAAGKVVNEAVEIPFFSPYFCSYASTCRTTGGFSAVLGFYLYILWQGTGREAVLGFLGNRGFCCTGWALFSRLSDFPR
jgi:hypothetical protein